MTVPKFIWQFDILRAVAVLVVMAFHIGHDWRSGIPRPFSAWGWAGVDLFFVLSGFLITGILWETKSDPKYFRNFYARRILRIWPLYFVLVGTMMVLLPRLAPALAAPSVATAYPRWAYLLFVQNWFDNHKVLGPLAATWSLAVEEQFYVVWPVAVWLLSTRRLKAILLAVMVASPLSRLLIAYADIHVNAMSIRMDGLAMGALLAIIVRETEMATIRRIALVGTVPCAAAVTVALAMGWTVVALSLLPLTFAGIVCLSLTTKVVPRIRVLIYTGKLSYGLYLLHLPAFDVTRSRWIRDLLPHQAVLNDLCYTVLAFSAAYAIASVSWFCMETPALRLKRYFEPARVLLASVAEQRPREGLGRAVQMVSSSTDADQPRAPLGNDPRLSHTHSEDAKQLDPVLRSHLGLDR